jgi:hypothetical protein
MKTLSVPPNTVLSSATNAYRKDPSFNDLEAEKFCISGNESESIIRKMSSF